MPDDYRDFFRRKIDEIQRDLHVVQGGSLADYEASHAREQRRERLEAAAPAISGPDFVRIVNGTLDATDAVTLVRDWIVGEVRAPRFRRDPCQFLLLLGEKGRGKTVSCAYAIAEEQGIYVTADTMGTWRRSRAREDQDRYQALFSARLVALDDLGAEEFDARTAPVLFDLVNARQRAGMHTLITSNLAEPQLLQLYGQHGERALARIRHLGSVNEVQGPDLRTG